MSYRSPILTTLLLLGPCALAGDHDQLMAIYRANFPDKNHLAVVCEYGNSKQAVQELADAAPGALITVVDTRRPEDVGKAISIVRQHNPDALVLMPKDRVFGDGRFAATYLVRTLANNDNIYTIATTPRAIKQGAWFAIGSETGGELLVNPDIKGEVTVTFPGGNSVSRFMGERSATIQVVSMESAATR